MRHALLHRRAVPRALARHRPRAPGGSRADGTRARGTDVVPAIVGLAILGGLALLVAARVIDPTVGS